MKAAIKLLATREQWAEVCLRLLEDRSLRLATIVTFRIGHPYTLSSFYKRISDHKVPLRLLVGLTDENTPKQEVPDSVLSKAKEFAICAGPTASLRTIRDCHEKMFVFEMRNGSTHAIIGSRNFNQSNWHETSLLMSNCEIAVNLAARANMLWQQGKEVRHTQFERNLRAEYITRHKQVQEASR